MRIILCMYDYYIILLYMRVQCVRTCVGACVRTCMSVRACEHMRTCLQAHVRTLVRT